MTGAQSTTITIPNTTIRCSKLIFGTGSLLKVGSERNRLALLETAIERGFSHFDTAPYYGFGSAERDLSGILKKHPKAGVTTKVGIYSPGGEDQSASLAFLRKLTGKLVPSFSRPHIDFTLSRARSALEGSLRRLRREHIELYLLHEPKLELINTDEWLVWLDDCVRSGKIGTFGLAPAAEDLGPFLTHAPQLARVIQISDSLDRNEANVLLDHQRPLQITYGYVSAAMSRATAIPVPDILRLAIARNSTGAIIVSTTRRERVREYGLLLDSPQ